MALRALFLLARVGSQLHTLLGIISGAPRQCERQARFDVLSQLIGLLPKHSSSMVPRHCVIYVCWLESLHAALLLWWSTPSAREAGTLSRALSLVTYLPQRASSVALRALFSFARVSLQRRTLLSLAGGARLRRERQARFDVLSRLV